MEIVIISIVLIGFAILVALAMHSLYRDSQRFRNNDKDNQEDDE
jgi:hypothetical protein